MLSKEQFEASANFMKTKARKLDKLIFSWEFEDSNSQLVIDELQNYQNQNGGFGHSLEPDIRMKDSSVIATTVAIQYLNELNLSGTETPMIKKTIEYLVENVRKYSDGSNIIYYWHPTGSSIQNTNHAPWWTFSGNTPPRMEDWPNPNVEIIGYLIQYQEFAPKEFVNQLKEDLNYYLKNTTTLTGNVYYNFLCFKRILNHVDRKIQDKIFHLIDKTFETGELLQPRKMKEIKIQWLVTEKSSYLYTKHPNVIQDRLMDEILKTSKDGGWHPNWKWGTDKLWNIVEKEWTGKITYDTLVTLKYFDLIEGLENN